jgi:Protein of unknown function (DUF4231)
MEDSKEKLQPQEHSQQNALPKNPVSSLYDHNTHSQINPNYPPSPPPMPYGGYNNNQQRDPMISLPSYGQAPTDYELRNPLYSSPPPYYGVPSSQSPLQQYREYVKLRISFYSKNASKLRWIHNSLQAIILIGAALVSISIGFPDVPKWLPPLISGIVTIATVIANYYKFGDKSRDLYRSAEDTQQEYNMFKSKRGSYKNLSETDALELLQDKIDTIRREQFGRTFSFEDQKEMQKK